jgi:hypothetical protein
MKSEVLISILVFMGLLVEANAQEYEWNGNAGTNDFFNEANWGRTSDGQAPEEGEIDPSKPINMDLELSGKAVADGIIQFGTGSLSIANGELEASDITGGSLEIGENGYLYLNGSGAILENADVSFLSPLCWIRAENVLPNDIHNQILENITYKEEAGLYQENIRLDNYYTKGTVIRPHDITVEPLQVFSSSSLQGTSAGISTDSVFSGNFIPGGLNNNISSFRLRRGYMVTMAVEEDGTGKSKVYIASEKDLVVDVLPGILSAGISFIRVLPWNWVSKRGTGGDVAGLDNSWYYKWSNNDNSDLQREYAPMAWGHSNANDMSDILNFRSKYKTTHVMGFNEPDDCNGQSGQYGNLCVVDTAVNLYRNLMKTGMRLVSPGCREGAWDDWLNEFHEKATAEDIRIDVIAVHWYDWGGNPGNTPNANPENVFNRFKNYLNKVYELFGLPIWITEFNANPGRNTWVQLEFMKLAIPYLEQLDYVERYSWFQPVSGTADYYNENGFLTPVGEYYKSEATSPSIPGDYWGGSNNLSIASGISSENEMGSSRITIYPNPAEEFLFIDSGNQIKDLAVYDLGGKEIISATGPGNSIFVGSLSPGLYFIRVNRSIRKFIKS